MSHCKIISVICCFFSSWAVAESLPSNIQPMVPELVQIYRDLHQMPELSMHEEKTAARLLTELKKLNVEVTSGVGGNGIVVVLRNGPGPVIMYRTDLDALPLEEATKLPYASKNKGVMHACGHDIHMTLWLGLIRYFAANQSTWNGTLVFIAQPAEEIGRGASAMLADNLFKRFPKPDLALAVHVDPSHAAGKVSYRAGYALAAVDSVDVTLIGRGGHGAMPHLAIDPVVMAARYIVDLQSIPSREIDANEPVVLTVGSLQAGTKRNVIADKAELQMTLRTFSPKVRARAIELIRRKAQAAALSVGATEPKVVVESNSVPALYNDPTLVEKILPPLKSAIGAENVEPQDRVMVGEDFSRYFVEGKVPVVMLFLGSIRSDRLEKLRGITGGEPTLHSSTYFPDSKETITTGLVSMTRIIESLLR